MKREIVPKSEAEPRYQTILRSEAEPRCDTIAISEEIPRSEAAPWSAVLLKGGTSHVRYDTTAEIAPFSQASS